MDTYLSAIDKYLKEKQEEYERQREQEIVLENLLTNADPWLESNSMTALLDSPLQSTDENVSSNLPLFQEQQATELPARKRPGRKPKQVSPAVRKAQNREAQRAFRERRERYVNDLERTVRKLKTQRQQMANEMCQLRSQLESNRVELWYLRGVVLSLHFICFINQLRIPEHTPYLSDSELSTIKRTTPRAVESYLSAKQRNNKLFKPPTAPSLAKKDEDEDEMERDDDSNNMNVIWLQQPEKMVIKLQREEEKKGEEVVESSAQTEKNMEAINQIRQHLIPYQNDENEASLRMRSTTLQMSVDHDPRVDIIPFPIMRDRMILFRDLIDFDHCFSVLLKSAVFLGGDPTLHVNWELPAEIFKHYWFFSTNYDRHKVDYWQLHKNCSVHSSLTQPPSMTNPYINALTNVIYKQFTTSPSSRQPQAGTIGK
ncbi:hypothetical protein G6F70_003698 [Rhizopus microsporus]|uniref:BZIP domain-containing protein n=2 Tax=Rhizopus TaxID=4842 RepID=A0A367JNW8_RHIAZ|nr:hypothetical protein G6F71_008577 [Rhizopus microsporus]RCH91618.1 hypothetical protein CU097_002501 [Rhizopus azygosporus]KAG1200848.1 hypothetical protein G6F70_003698 [Rhizopus microsporus]KAG1212728.1 hypothetical protein G6F69_003460 [Rhizopus microsporus]KAG1234750.1 hypothetical protein G6F67_003298 [Rhizopus microsporus]